MELQNEIVLIQGSAEVVSALDLWYLKFIGT